VTPKRASITWADTIQPEPVTWAWRGSLEDFYEDAEGAEPIDVASSESSGRIAAGTIAVAAGPEGVGKSSFGITLAAHVSAGRLPGAWYGSPMNVLYAAVEDSWAHTLVPRLMAADADLSRIGRFEVATEADSVATLSLPHDNELFEAAIDEHNVALVVLDPLMSLISDRIDTHRERNVREALDPLAKIADRTQAVILGIAHFNKGSGSDISARITGSGAFKNVPRAIFGFGRDPESSDGVCVLTQSKNSLGRSDLPSIRYRIESVGIETPKGEAITGRFTPLGVSARTLEDILAASTGGPMSKADGEKLSEVEHFIILYIRVYGNDSGEVSAREVLTEGVKAGFSENELKKARSAMKHRVGTRKAGKDAGWVWYLVGDGAEERIVGAEAL
jgi:hypothetical protein